MERRELAANHGMLFVFPREAPQQFWMKNTLIPLDMIFIRADGTIAGIVADAEPLTLTGRGVSAPSLYVPRGQRRLGERAPSLPPATV